jgi:hypothetical protein
MNQTLVDRLTSRKFIAFVVGIVAAGAYAFHLIDATGMGAIVAAAGTYQIGEGLADFGQSRAQVQMAALTAPILPPIVSTELGRGE